MAKTVPGRRVVVAETKLNDTVDAIKASDLKVPEKATQRPVNIRKLSYKERLQRRLRMADMALEKYEKRLEAEEHLEPEEERLFLAHQDSVRKLEATLAQLEHKDTSAADKTDLELAIEMVEKGMDKSDVLRILKNPQLVIDLEEALNAQQ